MSNLTGKKVNLMPPPFPNKSVTVLFYSQDRPGGGFRVTNILFSKYMDALIRLNRERELGGNSDAFPSPLHTEFTPTNKKKKKIKYPI